MNNVDHERASRVRIGDYILQPDTFISFLVAYREDGEEMPKPLMGKWTDQESFRKACQSHHGDGYSPQGLKDRAKQEAEASAALATSDVR